MATAHQVPASPNCQAKPVPEDADYSARQLRLLAAPLPEAEIDALYAVLS